MDSRISSGNFAFAVGWRTLLAASFAFLLLHVLTATHYYATALVLTGLIALTVMDTTRFYMRAGRMTDALPAIGQRDQARQLDQTLALLDTVTVALIALGQDGHITFSNRAARLLAGEEVGRLMDMRALGAKAAGVILALPAGARQIVTIADGRLMLVWTSGFSVPGIPPQKLVSLQAVAGELDAVQLKAWQDMTRVLSHEMMNSLTPIASLSETLFGLLRGRDEPDAEIAEAVGTIARRSQHLMNFVERYRQVADLPRPQLRSITATTFIRDIDALMSPTFAARGIAYSSSVKPPYLILNADQEFLSQAIINLLHNAVDAVANASNPEIALSCELANSEITLSVTDNGHGITADRMQEIFVPFFTTKLGGSGIGLTLARQIALAHRGNISLCENTDGGMTFVITIPADVTNF